MRSLAHALSSWRHWPLAVWLVLIITLLLLGMIGALSLLALNTEQRLHVAIAAALLGALLALLLSRYARLERTVAARTEALQESESRFRQVVASISDHIYVMEKKPEAPWQNLYQSPNMAALTGYPRERFAEDWEMWPSLIHPEDLARAEAQLTRYEQGEDSEVEYRLRHADGRTIWVRDSGHVEKDDPTPGSLTAYGVVSDISARKAAEEERARFIRQLRTAAELSEHLTAILDPSDLVRESAILLHACFALYHVSIYLLDDEEAMLLRQATVGAEESDPSTISLKDAQRTIARAARERKALLVEEGTALPPGIVAEAALPLIAQGRLLGVLVIQENEPGRLTPADMDVFSTLTGQLATALQNARLYQESQESARRLRELDRLKSEFLASMSHELRTPLNSIIGYTEILLMGISGSLSDPVREDIDTIRQSSLHLLRLINDILDLAKIEAGHMTLTLEPVAVGELLEQVRVSNLGLVHQKPVEIVVEVEPALPPIQADPLRLSQVLNNLLSNAVKFTEAGHIWLRASKGVGGEAEQLLITVQDTGIGIPAENLDSIFEEFRQVDGSNSRRAEGSGLGLAITRHLVALHGGSISVESELGKGSTFTVRLPYLAESQPHEREH